MKAITVFFACFYFRSCFPHFLDIRNSIQAARIFCQYYEGKQNRLKIAHKRKLKKVWKKNLHANAHANFARSVFGIFDKGNSLHIYSFVFTQQKHKRQLFSLLQIWLHTKNRIIPKKKKASFLSCNSVTPGNKTSQRF